ncbi:phosphatidate cytidylyltransferase [Radicibacter daui]|uniref:phosphatidate cytidylyltransferase n=1 Tax=Radicibacter daui TaxID=3064829 RepID=UPI004046BA73
MALPKDLLPRFLSASVLAPVVLVGLWLGGTVFTLMMAVIALVGVYEWTRICGAPRRDWPVWAALALTILSIATSATLGSGAGLITVLAGAVIFRVALFFAPLARNLTAFGLAYVTIAAIGLVWLRSIPEIGAELVVCLLVAVWATDIGAYFSGRLIGGPRIAPSISPNKTWAGLIGGMACSGLVMALLADVLFDIDWPLHVPVFGAGALLAVVAQVGDFGESALKRRFGVKDSGHIIPGHGGVLDRVDGVLSAAPVMAIVIFLARANGFEF